MSWPPVLFVSGSEDFLRRRFIDELLEQLRTEGRVVDYADGKVKGSVESILDGGTFMTVETVIVISNPEKLDLALLEEHHKAKDSTYILLCHIEGNPDGRTAFGKLVKAMEKQHKAFPSPPSWKADEVAVDFCLDESKRYGKTMEKRGAQALVSAAGSDLGVLHFEVLKAATLASAKGASVIDTSHIKGSFASLTEADVLPVLRALEERDMKRTLRMLERVKTTSRSDPTIKVCRILGATIHKWLAAANLDGLGVSPKEAASQLGMKNAWYYETKILPAAQAWKEPGLIRLSQALAASERAVLAGHVDPWVELLTRVARAFQESP